MPKELPTLGELETHVLRLVWQMQPCTERQISELVQEERSVGRTTVLKTIQRLEAKQLLSRVKDTSPVQYKATVEEKRVLPELVRRFVSGILGGSTEPLVTYLTDSEELSADDVDTLKSILNKLETDEHHSKSL